jgi:hypothetical protein
MARFRGSLIDTGSNAKTVKSDAGGVYVTAILYLAAAENVAGINLCAMARLAGCINACLVSAGKGAMSNVKKGRARKTILLRDNKEEFLRQLWNDISRFESWAKNKGLIPVVRLNGTSDLLIERFARNGDSIFKAFPGVQFYDYSKIPNRDVSKISNYHLTLSYSESNPRFTAKIKDAMRKNPLQNVAVVFRDPSNLPKTFLGRKVIDGDKTDLRFLDPAGVVVALYAKGKAKKDESGFVIDNYSTGEKIGKRVLK